MIASTALAATQFLSLMRPITGGASRGGTGGFTLGLWDVGAWAAWGSRGRSGQRVQARVLRSSYNEKSAILFICFSVAKGRT
jgi:hypothetical protein